MHINDPEETANSGLSLAAHTVSQDVSAHTVSVYISDFFLTNLLISMHVREEKSTNCRHCHCMNQQLHAFSFNGHSR